MSETGIKGIVLDNIPLNVMTVAFMRKLDKFDCAVVMDEQGGEKYAKAQLAVLDAVIGAKANVRMVCRFIKGHWRGF